LRILVCGGRDYQNEEELSNILDVLHSKTPVSVVISGNARGADSLGENWAKKRGISVLKFPADWATYGRSAGHIRNREMLEKGGPNLVVAFPGGAGTANMIRQARQKGVPVVDVSRPHGDSLQNQGDNKER